MSDVSPHIERNGGMANLYPSNYERELHPDLAIAQRQIAHLRAEFQELIDEFEDALPYVPEWASRKWGYDKHIQKAKDALL